MKAISRDVAALLRRPLRVAAFAALIGALLGAARWVRSDTIALTTTLPGPVGFFSRLTATHDAILARDADRVGFGTAAPSHKAAVQGGLRVRGTVRAGGMSVLGKPAVNELVCAPPIVCQRSGNKYSISLQP